jgi:hypothetical protein
MDSIRISAVSRRLGRTAQLLALALALQLALPAVSGAQAFAPREGTADSGRSATAHPKVGQTSAGERATYELRLAGLEVGTGSLEVLGEERVRGFNTLHATLQVSGGVLFATVNDRLDSWIDPDRLFSRRFVQDQNELTTRSHREYELSPEEKTYHLVGGGEAGALASTEPLDDLSFLFYARTLPLRVGDVDTIPRYFKPGHDVILRVLRKERIQVPAGTFETIVVQPTITNAGGLFGQGGQAELYFSDDAARTLVMLRSKVPVVGALSLHLKEYRSGRS